MLFALLCRGGSVVEMRDGGTLVGSSLVTWTCQGRRTCMGSPLPVRSRAGFCAAVSELFLRRQVCRAQSL